MKAKTTRRKPHPAEVKLAALRALNSAVAKPCGPCDLDQLMTSRVTRMLAAGQDAADIAITLDVPMDAVIPILWRVAQQP